MAKKKSKIRAVNLDRVWMIVMPGNAGVVYDAMSNHSVEEAWHKAIKVMNITGMDREYLSWAGYKAKRVTISTIEHVRMGS